MAAKSVKQAKLAAVEKSAKQARPVKLAAAERLVKLVKQARAVQRISHGPTVVIAPLSLIGSQVAAKWVKPVKLVAAEKSAKQARPVKLAAVERLEKPVKLVRAEAKPITTIGTNAGSQFRYKKSKKGSTFVGPFKSILLNSFGFETSNVFSW